MIREALPEREDAIEDTAVPIPEYTGQSDTMRVLRVQLEFRAPGLLFSAAPDPYKREAERAPGNGAKAPKPPKLSLAEQARRARYLVPGSDDHLALPARNLLGTLKGAGRAFRVERGLPRIATQVAAGAAILPPMIPLLGLGKGGKWTPRTAYRDFVRPVPIPGRKPGGTVACARALLEPPLRTDVFELCLSTTLFAPWESDPKRDSEALQGKKLIEALFHQAGEYVGLCAWRPSAPFSPGPFGKFRLLSLEETEEIRDVDAVWQRAFEVSEQAAI